MTADTSVGVSDSQSGVDDANLPPVYQEMLAEYSSADQAGRNEENTRAVKRRKVGERRVSLSGDLAWLPEGEITGAVDKPVQTVYDVDASEESDAEDWEDVELPASDPARQMPAHISTGARDSEEPLQITLERHEDKGKQRAVPRRKAVSATERKWRLDIHKVHLLCLLSHVQMRNLWCNDEDVQVINLILLVYVFTAHGCLVEDLETHSVQTDYLLFESERRPSADDPFHDLCRWAQTSCGDLPEEVQSYSTRNEAVILAG